MQSLNILFMEPFYGGSHKEFADGLVRHSRHSITLKTLPARFWKWRMRGAALYFAETIDEWSSFDLILISDLMSLADLKALVPGVLPPTAVYFHENQLAYPLAPGEEMDYQFGFTNITTAMTADSLIFNSQFQLNAFINELPRFIRRMPDFRPKSITDQIREKCRVIYPGCDLSPLVSRDTAGQTPPLILWNHRWEFDKNPESFFQVLDELDDQVMDFNLALLGENFSRIPVCFEAARERYGDRILIMGYRESREEYYAWLRRSDIVVSCALQENFGLAIIEAIAAGAWPLLPDRLSYPEVLPVRFHNDHIYGSTAELLGKLRNLLVSPVPAHPDLTTAMLIHDWENRITEYDDLFTKLANHGSG